MSGEVPLQINLFSGELVDNRTRHQKARDRQSHQLAMFSVRETVDIGKSAHPYLSSVQRGTLELIIEDVRTEEEIERDLMREAEALTGTLFPDMPTLDKEDEREQEDLDTDNDNEPEKIPDGSEEVTKLSIYRTLIGIAHEKAVTVWIDSAYRQRFYNQLPLTILAAQGIGLTASEISTAVQIGEFLGNRERQDAEQTSSVVFEAIGTNTTPPANTVISTPEHATVPNQQVASRLDTPHSGLRACLRGEAVAVRRRQPTTNPSKVVPTLWMDSDYVRKRLPYMSEAIGLIGEEATSALAEQVSAALEETYWSMLGIVLSQFVHEDTLADETQVAS